MKFDEPMCEFSTVPTPEGKFTHTCVGGITRTTRSAKLHRQCTCNLAGPPGRHDACVHRGAETRRISCPTCKGVVQQKVFACAVYGECSLSAIPQIRKCSRKCNGFKAATL